MTDDPLFNEDDIYIDERIDSKPLATYHYKMLLLPEDSDIVTVDRALLVQMTEHLDAIRLLDICDIDTVKRNREHVAACKVLCEQMVGERGA